MKHWLYQKKKNKKTSYIQVINFFIYLFFPKEKVFYLSLLEASSYFLMFAMQVAESSIRICILQNEIYYPIQTITVWHFSYLQLSNSGLSFNVYYETKFGLRRLIYELPKGLLPCSPIHALRRKNYFFLFWPFQGLIINWFVFKSEFKWAEPVLWRPKLS